VALAEIYDADLTGASRLVNVSGRLQIGTGDNVGIAGLVIAGDTLETVLIRAVGPSLASHGVTGVLLAPQITLYHDHNVLATNTGWADSASIAAVGAQVGAFALATGSQDAALVAQLAPGAYTVVVSGQSDSTGVALIEIYEVP
jgi:hypothetical protein